MSAPVCAASESIAQAALPTLVDFSIAGLRSMYVPEKRLFCHRVIRTGQDLYREGVSPRYTIMTLLGLNRYEEVGFESSFPVHELTAALVQDTGWLAGTGDLGLLLWACAEIAPELLEECIRKTNAMSALEDSAEARSGSTMAMAWFLTGIAKRVLAEPSQRTTWERVARHCYDVLRRNQERSGFFGHLAKGHGPAGLLRGRIGSFADQVYPIVALTEFGLAFEVEEALVSAEACARAICGVQGALGQWWWHYDAPSGRVVQRYPVYSVHQDGMAPMALFAVSNATGRDFSEPAMKGLEWISGRNELCEDLRDPRLGVIWRSIRFTGTGRMLQHEGRFLMQSTIHASSIRSLTVLHECRPYHLGWILYAFCGRHGRRGRL